MISYIIVAVVAALVGAVGGVLFYKNNQKKVATIVQVASQVSTAAQVAAKTLTK